MHDGLRKSKLFLRLVDGVPSKPTASQNIGAKDIVSPRRHEGLLEAASIPIRMRWRRLRMCCDRAVSAGKKPRGGRAKQ